MRSFFRALLVLLAVAGTASAADRSAEASAFVDLLAGGHMAEAVAHFDERMTNALPEAKLRGAWESVSKSVGPFQSRVRVSVTRQGPYDIAVVTAKFERGFVDVKVVFDSGGKVAGLFFSPAKPPAELKPPPYAAPESFVESEVTVGTRDWPLGGTLTVPVGNGPFAAVVLVQGSGPQDRNETIGPNQPFRDLAWGLASRGVAVLRYDKRTKTYGEKMLAQRQRLTVNEETVDDALLAAAFLQATPKIDPRRIFILGHSLGGMLIPRIAQRDKNAAGFVILAGTTRPLEDVIVEQMTYIQSLGGATAEDVAKAKADALKVKALDPASDATLMGVPAAYWRDLKNVRPATDAKNIAKPILILQGERDYQATMLDFKNWKDALGERKNVRLKSYPDLNHLFMKGEGKATPAEYDRPGYVDARVIEDIVTWIRDCCPAVSPR